MTNYLRVDAVNRQLVMDKTFAKNAQIVGSAEYDQHMRSHKERILYLHIWSGHVRIENLLRPQNIMFHQTFFLKGLQGKFSIVL